MCPLVMGLKLPQASKITCVLVVSVMARAGPSRWPRGRFSFCVSMCLNCRTHNIASKSHLYSLVSLPKGGFLPDREHVSSTVVSIVTWTVSPPPRRARRSRRRGRWRRPPAPVVPRGRSEEPERRAEASRKDAAAEDEPAERAVSPAGRSPEG